jgi:hypothetical protein
MTLNAIRFLSLFLVALALVPAGAHVLELPAKIRLGAEEYLAVQQLYRGWALMGIAVVGVLLSTLTLAAMSRHRAGEFGLALLAAACFAGALAVFFAFTYPVNQLTGNWTALPENWPVLRSQWEYSHALGAGLQLVALVSLILALVRGRSATAPTGASSR